MGILNNNYSEKDIELMIFEHTDEMPSRGFDEFYKNVKRQVSVPDGFIMDIFTWQIVDNIFFGKVIELKKEYIDMKAFKQASDYYCALLIGLHTFYKQVNVEIILIGKSLSDDIYDIAVINSPNLKLYTYDFNYNGLILERYDVYNECINLGTCQPENRMAEFTLFKQKYLD